MITFEEAKELLYYNPDTGSLFWKVKTNNVVPFQRAGVVGKHSNGKRYVRVQLKGKTYLVHRIAWLLVHKQFPQSYIDHVDGDGTNNRLSNLRLVNAAQNQRNMKLNRRNKSGVSGVWFNKQTQRWVARIGSRQTYRGLGSYKNKEDAIAARKQAEAELGYHPSHGSQRSL